jgi:hypothetical protein
MTSTTQSRLHSDWKFGRADLIRSGNICDERMSKPPVQAHLSTGGSLGSKDSPRVSSDVATAMQTTASRSVQVVANQGGIEEIAHAHS